MRDRELRAFAEPFGPSYSLSKGGLISYTCPNCDSSGIERVPPSYQGYCRSCRTWWPWRTRTKRRLATGRDYPGLDDLVGD